ncbi:hypothetical protein NCCP1664_06150 [Zafaria cholistanensis]|uniref:Uncharacterized protein n=1 Tax=Zafaria cholistanensis TaxID=1682741 RepID=A0A5A7NQM2_9MICC|nr:hypothetical protein [Zafaria cholistanensis]GER22118.1 hypothetical protein NCCP1664_06150 [Zafaria cholistanensis]
MSALALVLLVMSGIVGLPQYFARFRGRGYRALYGFAVVQSVLLGTSAVVALASDGSAGPAAPVAVAFSVAAATLGGGPLTVAVLRLSRRADLEEAEAGAGTPEGAGAAAGALAAASGAAALRGGTWIGLLERTGIAATLWAGWPEGLAVVLAVKGLGRYSELDKDGAAERFILGTFASVLWACACTGVGMLLR